MSASFTLFGKTIEQWTFSGEEQVAFLDQWLKADRYKLTTKEFCQSLVENGTDALKQIGQAGLDAPGQGQRFVDVLEGWFPGCGSKLNTRGGKRRSASYRIANRD
ncbi:hypothetical protein [Vibrio parahaemolyticus]|uniref:hypothetical protein n=1 Tax=Vibrio parahaemolyticus TaxID=670 RepID=UPI0020BE32E3|nr:hypothetical protein [Vibrio parahaemolyticus]